MRRRCFVVGIALLENDRLFREIRFDLIALISLNFYDSVFSREVVCATGAASSLQLARHLFQEKFILGKATDDSDGLSFAAPCVDFQSRLEVS